MTVKELMSKLERMDEDTEVMYAYKYGDYWDTTVVSDVLEVEQEEVEWSGYHEMYTLPDDTADDDDDEEKKTKEAVVLR